MDFFCAKIVAVSPFDGSDRWGKCVNLFAAELVLDNVEGLAALNRNNNNAFVTAVAELTRPAELLDFKFRLLKWKSYQMAAYPVPA